MSDMTGLGSFHDSTSKRWRSPDLLHFWAWQS